MPTSKLPHPLNCERCRAAMTLARRLPKVGPHPELLTYRCDSCGHVETREADDRGSPGRARR